MEEICKHARILHSAQRLFEKQGFEATSVNEIVKHAKVAKGTFYVYYKDKNDLISQILTNKHGAMLNELINTSYRVAQLEGRSWGICFIDALITFYMDHPDILRLVQKNVALVFETKENRLQVFARIEHFDEFLTSIAHPNEQTQQTLNRFLLMMELIGVTCFNTTFYEQPDTPEHIIPLLKGAMQKMFE